VLRVAQQNHISAETDEVFGGGRNQSLFYAKEVELVLLHSIAPSCYYVTTAVAEVGDLHELPCLYVSQRISYKRLALHHRDGLTSYGSWCADQLAS